MRGSASLGAAGYLGPHEQASDEKNLMNTLRYKRLALSPKSKCKAGKLVPAKSKNLREVTGLVDHFVRNPLALACCALGNLPSSYQLPQYGSSY